MHHHHHHHHHPHHDHGHGHEQRNESTINNPQVPYNGEIPGPLNPGARIFVKGHIPHHSQGFQVNLLTNHGDIAIHINPRFSIRQIVRNTRRGNWETEERHGHFPFNQGQSFELVITPEFDHYKVAVSGSHIFDYHHRIPLGEVKRIGVEGEVELYQIAFTGIAPRSNDTINPSIPVVIPVHGGFHPGKMIQIYGSVPHHANRFQVNLQIGSSYEASDVALHFNPRWDNGQVVVRNHKRYGNWGGEERHQPHFPFHKGANFDILILNEANEWKVAVNGQHFITFPHHFPSHQVDHLSILGDVQISAIKQFN